MWPSSTSMKEAYKKDGVKLFRRVCCNSIRCNGLNYKRADLDKLQEEFFYNKVGRTLAEVAKRNCGCSIPWTIQGQVRPGSEPSDLVENVPAQCKEGATR